MCAEAQGRASSRMKDKTKTALDEARILVLGIQVAVGFGYQSIFQKNFANLPQAAQDLKIVTLMLMLVALGFILAPAPYNEIVEHDNEDPRYLRFVTTVIGIALLPFAIGFSGDIFVAVQQVAGIAPGIVAAIIALLFALLLWYGLELIVGKPPQGDEFAGQEEETGDSDKGQAMQSQKPTPLKDKIEFVLTETRVVLPGSQALLGFQFATMFTEAFDKLPSSMKYLHLASLCAIAVSIMMLIAPAAFHRLADKGQSTRRLHTFGSVMILGAMFFLAAGIAGELYIVVLQVTKSDPLALVSSIFLLVFFYSLWFGYSLIKRGERRESEPVEEQSPRPAATR
jgi:hypothetical protein